MSKNNNQIETTKPEFENFLNLQTVQIANPFDPDYQQPIKYGDYTKLEIGNNNLRVLSEGIDGCEYWQDYYDEQEKKTKSRPIRVLTSQFATLPTSDWNYFNACFLWNYKAQKIQILCTAKAGIRKGLQTLSKNRKWGSLTDYDICVTRTQTDPSDIKKVEYTVTPEPKAVLDPQIATRWQESGFDRSSLFLLFQGLDPFEQMKKAREEAKNL